MSNKGLALEKIEEVWNSKIPLGEKIRVIASEYSAAGLDLETAAARIKATNSEIESLLTLSGHSDEIVELISKANPPKNLWLILACSNEDELKFALQTMLSGREIKGQNSTKYYHDLIAAKDGPTVVQRLAKLDPKIVKHFAEKGNKYQILTENEYKFLAKSVATCLRINRELSEKQMNWFKSLLEKLVQNKVIIANSQDGDQEQCDVVLKALK